jgi:uncharacterized protein with PIN domain
MMNWQHAMKENPLVDMTGKRCVRCNSVKISMNKYSTGKIGPHWYSYGRDKFQCATCYHYDLMKRHKERKKVKVGISVVS